MAMQVYAYALKDVPENLERMATEHLGSRLYHWVANGARLEMGQGFPSDPKDQGAAFGPKGEVRWWQSEDGYEALLLTNQPAAGLDLLPGEWEGKEETVLLQNLNDRRVRPNFPSYPHGDKSGRLRVMVYFQDGVATFISPRELMQED